MDHCLLIWDIGNTSCGPEGSRDIILLEGKIALYSDHLVTITIFGIHAQRNELRAAITMGEILTDRHNPQRAIGGSKSPRLKICH
jgi:hypothetical protein